MKRLLPWTLKETGRIVSESLRHRICQTLGPTFDISDDPAKWQMKKGHLKKKQKEVLVKPGDSKKVTSWIWRVQGALTDGMRE